ncbi:hypothetical protein Rsub_09855 [Raphidocelis subcapitata]|uniref:Uncharacterized protein n=1 Tax=Raphidocelis subcapitata TaxID=307507 RepID=A0A2V0PF26_9CHLO|nr:hypothetical protein Rsub_09855 [Raphidocelis subcapitata]|eukprot:GBF96513.1 hypothetical protein Rsub_09855 [Raphidocelis subcapitata]
MPSTSGSGGECGGALALAWPAPTLAPLAGAPPLCETRLRELRALGARRRDETPGPGAYTLPAPPPPRASHHRPLTPADGPRPLAPSEGSAREREMGRLAVGGCASAGSGGFERKTALLRRPSSAVVGTAARQPRAPAYALSLSRSLQLRGAALAAAATADATAAAAPPSAEGRPEQGAPPAGCAAVASEDAAGFGRRGVTAGAGPASHAPPPRQGRPTAAKTADRRLPLPPRLLREVRHFAALRGSQLAAAGPGAAGQTPQAEEGPPGAPAHAPGPGARAAAVAAHLAEQRRRWEAASVAQLRALRCEGGCR